RALPLADVQLANLLTDLVRLGGKATAIGHLFQGINGLGYEAKPAGCCRCGSVFDQPLQYGLDIALGPGGKSNAVFSHLTTRHFDAMLLGEGLERCSRSLRAACGDVR